MTLVRSTVLLAILVSGAALAATAVVSEIVTPAAIGSGEPFVFATHDGLLMS